jgi:hypothetical protein
MTLRREAAQVRCEVPLLHRHGVSQVGVTGVRNGRDHRLWPRSSGRESLKLGQVRQVPLAISSQQTKLRFQRPAIRLRCQQPELCGLSCSTASISDSAVLCLLASRVPPGNCQCTNITIGNRR